MRRSVSAVAQFARASEIATTLSGAGFEWLLAALGLRSCISVRCRLHCALGFEQCPHHVDMGVPLPQRLRIVLERLGPTFVKAGQMLALRPDYVPLAYASALRALHDSTLSFPSAEALQIVEAELGAPVEKLFAEFGSESVAAASLSQVYRAVTPDGRVVAVKVQRPGVEDMLERDLALLGVLARRLERRRPEAVAFRPSAAVAEFAEYTRRELDFRCEARTAERVRRLFGEEDRVVVPAVDWDRTTRRVLTMDYVDGVRPASAADLERVGLDPRELLRTSAEAMLRQIFEFGVFHADPHPGNVLFLPGNRVAFLDFGMSGQLALRERRRMAFMMWALMDGDYDTVADQLLRLSTVRPGADVAGFRAALAEAVEEWFAGSGSDYSMARLLLRELALGAEHGLVFPRQLMLLARSLLVLESTAMIIDPDLVLADVARPLLPELRRWLLFDPHNLEEAWRRNRFEYMELAFDLPDLLPELVARLRGPVEARAWSGEQPSRLSRLPLLAAVTIGAVAAGLRRWKR